MPRFFFHVRDGAEEPDSDGTELPDTCAARGQAIQMAGEILRDMGGKPWDGTEWGVTVANENGEVLFLLRFSVEECTP